MHEVTIGDARLILGDCREILPTLPKVDAVVTDPPYGVNLGLRTGSSRYLNEKYASIDDTPEYIETVCVPVIRKCLEHSERLAMTPGNRCMWSYPRPDDVGIWYNPASTNRGKWGFSYANALIFFYGRDPHNHGRGMRPNSIAGASDSVDGIDHPCPKPLLFTEWLVGRASLISETVLDPFMGSGTTGVACINAGRKFIGIEIEERYFNIAVERIKAAYAQQRLFA
jgi:DNA modification methylase